MTDPKAERKGKEVTLSKVSRYGDPGPCCRCDGDGPGIRVRKRGGVGTNEGRS